MDGSRVSVMNTESMMTIIDISEEDLQNDITSQKMGPTDALELLNQLNKERSQNRKMERDLLCELDEKNEESRWTKLFGTPLLEKNLKKFFANPTEGLVLKGSGFITEKKLTKLLTQTPDQGAKIKFLSLPSSPLLDSKTISTLVKGCPNLEYLNVSGCMMLEEIVTGKGEWSLLTRLEAKDCENLKRFISSSPITILRIGTNQKIEVFVEKHILDIFVMSTPKNEFDFLLEKGENFEIKSLKKDTSLDYFFQHTLLSKEWFDYYFRKPKITIGEHSISSAKDLEGFITSLDLRIHQSNQEAFQKIVQLDLKSLKSLQLPRFKGEGIRTFEDLIQGKWPKLIHLNLFDNEIRDEGLGILSQGKWPLLETLNLGNSKITKKGLLNFQLNTSWRKLKEITYCRSKPDFLDIYSENNGYLLQELNLSSSKITPSEIETIVKRSKWPNLKHLDLSDNPKVNDEALKILTQGNWPLLETLTLKRIQITNVGIDAIVNLSKWLNLKHLNLSDNEINDEGLAILSQGNWPLLETLNLSDSQITKKGLLKCILNGKWPRFKEINLPPNSNLTLGFCLQEFSRVKRLELNNLDITLVEIDLLAYKYQFQPLKYLDISNNQISDKGVSLLILAKWPSLKGLNMENTNITSKGIQTIVNQSRWPKLKFMNLSNNEIGDQGLLALARGKWPLLEELFIRNTQITSKGIGTVVSKMKLTSLKKLDISENIIKDEGLEILASAKWPEFQHLVYCNTQVTLKGNITLLENFLWPNLLHLEQSLMESFYNESPLSEIILATVPMYYKTEPILVTVLNVIWFDSKEINLSIREENFCEKIILLPRDKLNQLESLTFSLPAFSVIQSIIWPSTLKLLDLSNNSLSNEKILEDIFFTNPPLLEDLHLENTNLTTKGIEILIKKSSWPFLKKLCISHNQIFDTGLKILSNGDWPLLENLNLRNTHITAEGIQSLVSFSNWPNLKNLDLSDNMLFDRGLKILASGNWPLLENLSLRCTCITAVGIQSMTGFSEWQSLKILDLSDNALEDRGLKMLSSGKWPLLETLSLGCTSITKDGIQNMRRISEWSNLKNLDVSDNYIENAGLEF